MSWTGSLTRKFVMPVAEALIGRRNLVRLGRLITMESRLDGDNDMAGNGEQLVQIALLAGAGGAPVVFDVGANKGEWTAFLLQHAQGRAVSVHVFEPAAATFARLRENLMAHSGVKLVNQAMSDQVGVANLVIAGAGLGTNSLYGDASAAQAVEKVQLNTVDAYCREAGISHIDLIKIDTEGNDMAVLRGARAMFERHAIGMAQFEYNQRWIAPRHLLKDAFDFLLPFGYRIGKVTPRGIEFYPAWHFELESYREGNYLACLPQWAEKLPSVKWWHLE